MFRGFGIFRASTWVNLTKFAIVFIVAMNLARLDRLTGIAAGLALAALVLVWLATRLGLLPVGGDSPEWRRLIRRHGPALTKRYRQLVRINAYGAEEFDKWRDELVRFRESTKLSLDEKDIARFDALATRMVSKWASAQPDARIPEAMEEITPQDYEHLCADLLRKAGWEAEVTGQSGDQGIDILAQRHDMTVALQCKLYFGNPVGNKAVQEAHAAAGYVDADYAVVVSNRDFTNSAEQLARKLGVLLVHHSELPDLETMLQPAR
ncbi:restriction endonuclease [Labrys sp. (in: a-proteobacteria)]|uniref:restriction endonuclease n=1 Tax=Labrys sp. (in: a-proteobacteria) TaxID=1917972 RepID=UPI0039E22BBA